MGQRTQLVVKVTECIVSYNNPKPEFKTHTASYHNQWGLAKMQLKDIINLLNSYIDYNEYKFPDKLHKGWKLDEDEKCTDLTPEGVAEYLSHQDNNDGGAFLEINVKQGEIVNGNLILYSDPESERSCKIYGDNIVPYVSLKNYIKFHPHYYDKGFYMMFLTTLKYHNIKIITKPIDEGE